MKKLLASLLCVMMVFCMMPGMAFADGTASEDLEINDLDELKSFRENVNAGTTYAGKTVTLAADIDLAGEEWTPIGNSTNKFQGTFDGAGKIISNLVITGNNSNVGLFGFTTNGEIKNLTIKNAQVSGRLNVGAVAGTPYTSKYSNIKVTGHVEINGMAYVGGVGGKNAYANWTDITVDVDDTSYVNANSVENGTAYRTYVGGVIGFMGEGGHIFQNITSNIDVTGSTCDVGGITGIAHYDNSFINCVCSGDVEITNAGEASDAEEMGGIAGVWHNQDGKTVTFKDCVFTGTLKSNITEGIDLSDNTITGKAYNETGTGMLDIKPVAQIGTMGYDTLEDAVGAAQDGDTITLLISCAGGGIKVEEGRTITIDFNQHTYTVSGELVGSTGTVTQAMQLLKDANVTMKNGTLASDANAGTKRMIQNYSNLTLENMTIDGSNLPEGSYVMSNNNGATVLKGNTNIKIPADGYAFDVYYWPKGSYGDVSVTIGSDMTGMIEGKIEVAHDGTVSDDEAAQKATLAISGGNYTVKPAEKYLADGFEIITNTDGTYSVKKETPAPSYSGGGYVPVEKPEIIADAGADYDLSILGTTLKIAVKDGYELVDVTLNGVSKGAVTELKGLETGDKVVITTKAIGTGEPVADEAQLVARSAMSKAKGKKAIKVYWFNEDGSELTYDGYEIFRSTKRFKGYGTKPIFETEREAYWNTDIEMGTKYYYKVRGYNEVNGERVYSDWSLKAWRVAE